VYVDGDVRYFMEHRGPEYVIPFIIEGTPEPRADGERQCYPTSLPASILGVTLSEGTKEEALIKILARLLQVDYANLYRRHLRMARRFMMQVCAGLSAVLALVSGLALWALAAERRATEQRMEAEGLIRFLTFDMADEAFDYIPIQARLSIAEKIQGYYDRWKTRDLEALYSKARYLMDLASTANMSGNEEDNRKFRAEALAILEQLQAAEPDNEAYFELYAQVLRQMGVLLRDSDAEAAQGYCLKSLEAARVFVARNPNAYAAQAQLAESLSLLAGNAVVSGQTAEALAFFQECSATWDKLFDTFPQMNEEPYFMEKRAQLESSFGHFFRVQENAEQAAEWSSKAVVSWAAILAANPDNLNSQFHYGSELDTAMMLETRLGRLASADEHYREGLQVKRNLLARDPENVDYRFQLGVTLGYGGVLRRAQENFESARAFLGEAEKIIAPLVERYPEDESYRAMYGLIRDELGCLKYE
jgi:tetratricopeptide (TPR) repeat protein